MVGPPRILGCGSPLPTPCQEYLREVSGYPTQSCGAPGESMSFRATPLEPIRKSLSRANAPCLMLRRLPKRARRRRPATRRGPFASLLLDALSVPGPVPTSSKAPLAPDKLQAMCRGPYEAPGPHKASRDPFLRLCLAPGHVQHLWWTRNRHNIGIVSWHCLPWPCALIVSWKCHVSATAVALP